MTGPIWGSFQESDFHCTSGYIFSKPERGIWAAVKNFFLKNKEEVSIQDTRTSRIHTLYVPKETHKDFVRFHETFIQAMQQPPHQQRVQANQAIITSQIDRDDGLPSIQSIQSWPKLAIEEEYNKVPEAQKLQFLAKVEAAATILYVTGYEQAKVRKRIFEDPQSLRLAQEAARLVLKHHKPINAQNTKEEFTKESFRSCLSAAVLYFQGLKEQSKLSEFFPKFMERILSWALVYSSMEERKATRDREATLKRK